MPTPTPTASISAVAGTWTTIIRVQQGAGLMTWVLAQNGTVVSGDVHAGTLNGARLVTGTLAGSLQGDVLFFTITVPAGGFVFDPSCASTVEGFGNVRGSEIRGVYAGGASCAGVFNGEFVMTKQ